MAVSSPTLAEVNEILSRHWPLIASSQTATSPLPWQKTDGFSGSKIWQVQTAQQNYCLKAVPQSDVPRERLVLVQTILDFAKRRQNTLPLPMPIPTKEGEGLTWEHAHYWELVPWMPGKALLASKADAATVTIAFQATARLHLATAQWAQIDGTYAVEKSPGVILRQERLAQLKNGGIFDLVAAMGLAQKQGFNIALIKASEAILSHFWNLHEGLLSRLEVAKNLLVPTQPAVRDLRAEHFLFSPTEDGSTQWLSGMLDFGALRMDSVMLDVARLSTTLQPADLELQKIGLQAYREVRPLSPAEEDLLPALIESAPLHNGLQWLIWIFQERMRFEDWSAVLRRMQQIATHLDWQAKQATQQLNVSPGGILF